MGCIKDIIDLFERNGREAYVGESVSQAEHALQAAHLAQGAGAHAPLIAAALLHDIGHFIHPTAGPLNVIDRRHEQVGAAWLARWFGPEITEPIRLHVSAKRYICRLEPSYTGGLSLASVTSLELQGGPMNSAEVEAFEKNPYHRMAVQLRCWDDKAKVPGARVADVELYREILLSCCTSE